MTNAVGNERTALLLLVNTPGLGAVKIRRLLKHFDSAEATVQAPTEALAAVPGVGPRLAQAVEQAWHNGLWERDAELVERYGVSLVTLADPEYPEALRRIPDAPVLLYVKGQLPAASAPCVAVIGTRQASRYGLQMAKDISADLAAQGVTVVSGLARGVDTYAHEGALRTGKTVAVIGSGLAHIYPRENTELAQRIAESGAVVSEFPMLTPPDRTHFPQRNRIVSGMSLGTVLIEAKVRSGAMITVKRAIDQGREVFAIPGRADIETFTGNHSLIKDGCAQLVQSGQEILNALRIASNECQRDFQVALPQLDTEEQQLWDALSSEERTVEEIAEETKLPIAKLNILLMKLLLKQRIEKYPGNLFRRVG